MSNLPSPGRVIDELWPQDHDPKGGPQVFAMVDSGRDERIAPAMEKVPGAEVMFRGDGTPEVAAVAPWLLQLQPKQAITKWLISEGWGNSWGVLMEARTSVRDLVRHFRPCLTAQYRKKKLFFRIFDPRVLRVYLPTCHPDELKAIFGPVRRFVMETWDSDTAVEFQMERGRLLTREIRLYTLDGRATMPDWARREKAVKPEPAATEKSGRRDRRTRIYRG